jgi:hypothetical protein
MKKTHNIADFDKLCWLIKLGFDRSHPIILALEKSSGFKYEDAVKVVDKSRGKPIDIK